MNCLCKIFFIVVTINLINSAHSAEDSESSSTTTTYDFEETSEYKFENDSLENGSAESLIEDNGEESFYNLYCQAKSVVDRKLISLEESDLNTFIKLMHFKTPFDCDSTEKIYVDRTHENLLADIKSQGYDESKVNCIFENVLNLDFDQMHYRYNTLVYLKRYRSDLTSEPVFKENQFDLKVETKKKIEKSANLCSEVAVENRSTTERVAESTSHRVEITEHVVENTDIYCQVKSVIDQKLIDFESSDLVHKLPLPQLDVDCKKELEIISEKRHKILRGKFVAKGFDAATFECIYNNVVIRGYETLRYQSNTIKYFLQQKENVVSDDDAAMLNRNLAEINSRKNGIIKISYHLCNTEDEE